MKLVIDIVVLLIRKVNICENEMKEMKNIILFVEYSVKVMS